MNSIIRYSSWTFCLIGIFLTPSVIASNRITDAEIKAIQSLLKTPSTPIASLKKKTIKPEKKSTPSNIPTHYLLQAIRMNDARKVKALIHRGSDVTPSRGEPLSIAVQTKNIEIARILLENKADPNQAGFSFENSGVLGVAIKQKNSDMIKLLLQYGADPNIGSEYLKIDSIPDTPLFIAVRNNNLAIAKMLITSGANVNLPYPISIKALPHKKGAITTRTLLNHVNKNNNPQMYNILFGQK